jgi:hypothetical protein
MNYEEHHSRSIELRGEFWNKIGKVHKDVMAHFINPAFMAGAMWPSVRQAFLKIDTPSGTIIASDGLSDPYTDFDENPANQSYNGVGCEFYLECDEVLAFEALSTSWQFRTLYQAAQQAADNPNIASVIDEYTYLSTELYNTDAPDEFVNKDGRVGALLALPSPTVPSSVELSLEKVKMVNVKLLTLAELDYIVKNGEKGRMEIAELLLKQDKPGKSFISRSSVV